MQFRLSIDSVQLQKAVDAFHGITTPIYEDKYESAKLFKIMLMEAIPYSESMIHKLLIVTEREHRIYISVDLEDVGPETSLDNRKIEASGMQSDYLFKQRPNNGWWVSGFFGSLEKDEFIG
jgi:hypothetical protein